MKNILRVVILLCTLSVQAKDIPVPVNSDITPYVNQAQPGDNIILAAGTYSISGNAMLKTQVGFTGAGIDKTYISNYTWLNSGQPALAALNLQGGDGKGQVVQGFTLYGDPSRSSEGILVQGRNNVTLQNIKVQNFFYSGIELRSDYEKTMSGITIQDFVIKESSKESTAGSFGNLMLRGDLLNILIQRGTIEALTNNNVGPWGDKGSGYCIKGLSNYSGDFSKNEVQKNVRILYMVFKSKINAPWGGNVPNFNCEWWNVSVEELEIAFCKFNMQLSLEHGGQKQVTRSFWVHDNTFECEKGQSIELTASFSLVERNQFFLAKNQNAWNVFGTYNGQSNVRGIVFRYNTIDLAGKSPSIANSKGQYVGLVVENNIIKNGSATGVFFETDKAKGASVTWRNNTVPPSFARASYSGVGSSDVTLNFTDGMANIPDGPVVTPPVTPPDPVKPTDPKPSDPVVNNPPVVVPPTQGTAFKVVLPVDQSVIDLSKGSSMPISIIPGNVAVGKMFLQITRFDTRAVVWNETVTISDPKQAVSRSISYDKLKAANKYLLETKTLKSDGYSVVDQLYTTFNTTGTPGPSIPVDPPVVNPPATTKTVTITQKEVLGTPTSVKDTVAKKYIITVPYSTSETRKEQ